MLNNNPMQLEMITCPSCNNPFPKKRKELGYHVCVKCSTEMPKVGRIVTHGTGDHIYQEVEVVDYKTAQRLHELESYARGMKLVDVEMLDFNVDEGDQEREVQENVRKVLEDQDEEEEIVEDDSSVLGVLSREKPQ